MRLVEVYTSIQGEGPRVGLPTQFVRFGGCNLRCSGWACDTPFAIYPAEFRHTWEQVSPLEVFEKISPWPKHICLTGGEPLLQPKPELRSLAANLRASGYTFEMFTNGTFELPRVGCDYVMDWKLSGSGENAFNLTRVKNLDLLTTLDAVKFVVKDRNDFEEARHLWDVYIEGQRDRLSNFVVYAGVVWGKLEEKELVEWMLKERLPWKLNVQIHQHIWSPQERRR